jgi:membrane protease YdiL (CAAX protease family)
MPEPPIDPVLNGFVGGMFLLSVATFLYVVSLFRRGPVLPYEPRRCVPWGAPATILALLFVAMALASSVGSVAHDEPAAGQAATDVDRLAGSLIAQLSLVIPFVFAVIVLSGATPHDLGLPESGRVLARDVVIGVVGWLAVLAPIILLQAALMYLFRIKESGHELVKMLIDGQPDLMVLVLASLAAVVIAPICEELVFRLLLQGWLEKWEDGTDDESPMTNDECRMTDDESPMANDECAGEGALSVDTGQTQIRTEPAARGVAGLPHGWTPILISSLLFAAAHYGYGPEPVPLFFLALVLGFVYQRTHRIVPGIVIHALFNGFTMVILWRMALNGAK